MAPSHRKETISKRKTAESSPPGDIKIERRKCCVTHPGFNIRASSTSAFEGPSSKLKASTRTGINISWDNKGYPRSMQRKTSCRPSILSLDTGIYPSGVTSTHRSHMTPLGPLLGLVGVRASCGNILSNFQKFSPSGRPVGIRFGRFSRFIESAEPTTNPYGFLVVKQAEKTEGVSWPCKSKRSNEGCGSHADEGNFGAEGEGTQEAQMLRGV
ncbi:hypothetical protein CK203_079890 [Vitis vinifera]|uniref:Uncharacterized protein n=1 Tax=Vitis vinifera TaxID=29760 RepID=A0A438DHY8_VITVI|nr:hypothetical protein CK203_079890 [Vitis vinifera]